MENNDKLKIYKLLYPFTEDPHWLGTVGPLNFLRSYPIQPIHQLANNIPLGNLRQIPINHKNVEMWKGFFRQLLYERYFRAQPIKAQIITSFKELN